MADASGHLDAAIAMWRRSLSIEPDNPYVLAGLCCALFLRGDPEAETITDRAIAHGGLAWAWTTKGRLLTIAGDLEGARDAFDQALNLDPGNMERLFDVASALLRMGNATEGWPLHTAANRGDPRMAPVPPMPRWDGKSAVDRLIVLARLGYGDQVMFARYLPWLKNFAQEVIVVTRPDELSLYAQYEGRHWITTAADVDLTCDAYIENYAVAEIAWQAAFEPPVPAARALVQRDHLRVGIVWSGSDVTASNPIRRVPFEIMLRLAENADVHLFSFQTGDRSADIAKTHAQVLVKDMSAQIEWEWSLTAAALEQVDVVVAPDCGSAHLAASMGIKTCVMLAAYCDWRWGVKDTTPWYPSMTLFRQTRIGDWGPVISSVAATLEQWHADRQGARKEL